MNLSAMANVDDNVKSSAPGLRRLQCSNANCKLLALQYPDDDNNAMLNRQIMKQLIDNNNACNGVINDPICRI